MSFIKVSLGEQLLYHLNYQRTHFAKLTLNNHTITVTSPTFLTYNIERSMKYKTVGLKPGHKLFIRKRESAFDNRNILKDSTFGVFEDHKEMKTYEYAAFQKRVFNEKRIQKRKKRILMFFTIVAVIIILLSIPYIFEQLFNVEYLNVKF